MTIEEPGGMQQRLVGLESDVRAPGFRSPARTACRAVELATAAARGILTPELHHVAAGHITLTYPLVRPCCPTRGPLHVCQVGPGRRLASCAGTPFDDDCAVHEEMELAVVGVGARCLENYGGAAAGVDRAGVEAAPLAGRGVRSLVVVGDRDFRACGDRDAGWVVGVAAD